PEKAVSERLKEAAKAARAYISQNFQAPANPPPGGHNYVEPPRGPVTMLPPGAPPPSPSNTTEEEQALVDYLNERNAKKAQNMGVGYDTKKKAGTSSGSFLGLSPGSASSGVSRLTLIKSAWPRRKAARLVNSKT